MDRIDRTAQTLTNRIAQDTYRAIAAKRAEPVLAQAQAHAEAQRDQAWDEISQTRQANAIADGAANWQDQRLYTRHYGAGAAEVEDQARRQGWDQARTQQAKQDYARDFTKAMVKQAATN